MTSVGTLRIVICAKASQNVLGMTPNEACSNGNSVGIRWPKCLVTWQKWRLVSLACCCSLCQRLRAIPAAQSEVHALYGLDPFTLAQLAAKDAARAVQLQPRWPTAHLQQARGVCIYTGFRGLGFGWCVHVVGFSL